MNWLRLGSFVSVVLASIVLVATSAFGQNRPVHMWAVDLAGNGKDSIVLYDPDVDLEERALGILDIATFGKKFQQIFPWYYYGAVPPASSNMFVDDGRAPQGWSLSKSDTFIPCNVDGRGGEDLLVFSHERNLGILTGLGKLTALTGWVNPSSLDGQGHVGGPAGHWSFGTGDTFFPLEADGDRGPEILVYERTSRLGILNGERMGLRTAWICPYEAYESGGGYSYLQMPGRTDWQFGNTERFYPIDLDGNGKDEVAVWAEDRAMVLAVGRALSLRIVQMTEPDEPSAKFPGSGDWHISERDRPCVVDLNGDG